MSRILEIGRENITVTCEPGVITVDWETADEAEGLFYPAGPQALNMSTMGGNVALDSGGPRAVKYGVTRNYVLGVETVLADAEVPRSCGKTTRDVSGYNPHASVRRFRGAPGIFTEIIVRLLLLPQAKRRLICAFDRSTSLR